MTEEEIICEMDFLREHIDNLEEMYQLAHKLADLDDDEYEFEYSPKDLMNDIDRKLEDYKSELENREGDLENFRENQNEYLNWEYRKSTEAE